MLGGIFGSQCQSSVSKDWILSVIVCLKEFRIKLDLNKHIREVLEKIKELWYLRIMIFVHNEFTINGFGMCILKTVYMSQTSSNVVPVQGSSYKIRMGGGPYEGTLEHKGVIKCIQCNNPLIRYLFEEL